MIVVTVENKAQEILAVQLSNQLGAMRVALHDLGEATRIGIERMNEGRRPTRGVTILSDRYAEHATKVESLRDLAKDTISELNLDLILRTPARDLKIEVKA